MRWRERPEGGARPGRLRLAVLLVAILGACGGAVPAPTEAPASGASPTPGTSAAGSPAPEPVEPTPPPAGGDVEQSSLDLITQAVAEGGLDFPTSLIYRAYALFGDPRLPPEFAADGPIEEDSGLFLIPELAAAELPDEVLAALRPYVTSPLDPASAFHRTSEAAVPAIVPAVARPGPPAQQGSYAVECLESGWGSRNARVPIKIWIKCTGNYVREVEAALEVANAIWQPMTQLMGPPLLDVGDSYAGFDESIDVILTADEACPPDTGGCFAVKEGFLGWAKAFAPRAQDAGGPGSSGFMVIRRSLVMADPDEFRRTFIHELFHVQQYAHNWKLISRRTGEKDDRGNAIWDTFWFAEATARWAEFNFEKEAGRAASASHVLSQSYVGFAEESASLNAQTPFLHRYAAFVWPYFMAQRKGGAQEIAATWNVLRGAADWPAAMDAIDARLPFDAHFRDFALAGFNETLQDDDPLPIRFQHADASFPVGRPTGPHMRGRVTLTPREDAYRMTDLVRSLAATYWWFDVRQDVQKLTFDFGGLSPGATLAVDSLLLLPEGDTDLRWVHRPLANGKTEFCRTNAEEEVHAAIVVLSNHDHQGVDIEGEIAVEASAEPCSGLQLVYEYVGSGGHVAAVRFSLTFDLEPQEEGGWADEAEPTGTFWKNWDGGNDYCVVYGLEGYAEVMAVDVDGDLYIISAPSLITFSDGSEVNLPGPGGFTIPVGETQASRERAASDPDEVDGACFAFSNITETVTIRRP